MFIKHLHIKNFKSIALADIDFSPLTMIVGANAAGKSNLINVFRFIQDIARSGVDSAIALQGGIPYLVNVSIPREENMEIGFLIDLEDEGWIRNLRGCEYTLGVDQIECSFSIQPNRKGHGYHISHDLITITYSGLKHDQSKKNSDIIELNFKYVRIFERKSQKSKVQTSYEIVDSDASKDVSEFVKQIKNETIADFFSYIVDEDKNELMLNKISLLLPPCFSNDSFIRIFDFDPKELKKSSAIASAKMFAENGSNMASVLQDILRVKEKKTKLTKLINEFLPSIDALYVESNPDKSFSYKIKEHYSDKYFYANFLSDGTVSLLAIIIALYFEEESNVIVLEEPERNIHPRLLSNILASAEDVSEEKQIILTTHNPEFLKFAKTDCVRLVSRDCSGFTAVTSPANSKSVQAFMKNDLGLDDLFLQDLLEDHLQ